MTPPDSSIEQIIKQLEKMKTLQKYFLEMYYTFEEKFRDFIVHGEEVLTITKKSQGALDDIFLENARQELSSGYKKIAIATSELGNVIDSANANVKAAIQEIQKVIDANLQAAKLQAEDPVQDPPATSDD